jgi:site-specific DNA-methyltransferase (adenine-specific)
MTGTTPNVDTIIQGDCLEEMKKLPANSINLIYTDPPYFKVKDEPWDNQWENPAKFIDWIGKLCQEWQRILKPNGSLYVFASPKMAARVECKVGEYFNIVNRITWRKPPFSTKAEMFRKEDCRGFFPASEALIFAEHFGSDNIAKGEAGYGAKCDELRGFVFEPIRAYLDGERKRAGIKREDCNAACGFARIPGGMASRHYFSSSQWCLPTEEHYKALQELFNSNQSGRPIPPYEQFHEAPRTRFEPIPKPDVNEYLRADYEYLRADYEDLRADYEDLRRPFQVTSEVPYTDVWDFPTVGYYEGKHPCEKPIEMSRHIIAASSRPGDVVLDCFGGSCHVADACIQLNRRYIIIEQNAEYCRQARKRVSMIQPEAAQKRVAAVPARLDRWAEAEG